MTGVGCGDAQTTTGDLDRPAAWDYEGEVEVSGRSEGTGKTGTGGPPKDGSDHNLPDRTIRWS